MIDWGRRSAGLAVLGLTYVALRLVLVFELSDVFGYGEELAKGAMAKAFLDGLEVPVHALSYRYFEGGSFVSSSLTAAAFLVCGESLLALKLAAISMGLAILIAGWLALERMSGQVSANVFGALFVFSPAAFQKLSLLDLGHHFESSLFLLGMLAALAWIIRDERPSRGALLLLGVLGGLGTYYNLWVVVSVGVAFGILGFLRPAVLFSSRSWPALVGVCLGAAPLFWMLSRVGLRVFDIHGAVAIPGTNIDRPLVSADRDSFAFLASIWNAGDILARSAMAVGIALPLLAPLIALHLRGPSWKLTVALSVWLLLLVGSYLASPFVVGEVRHYFFLARLAPIWVLGVALTAGAIGTSVSGGGWMRHAAVVCLSILLADGVRDFAVTAHDGRPGDGRGAWTTLRGTKGYDYTGYIAFVGEHLEDMEPGATPVELARVFLGYDEPDREYLYTRIGEDILRKRSGTLAQGIHMATSVDPEGWSHIVLGLGRLVRKRTQDTRQALAGAAKYPVEGLRPILAEALGRAGFLHRASPENVQAELQEFADAQPLPILRPWLRGVGHRVHESFRLDRPAALDFINAQKPWMRADLRLGYEHALLLCRLP